MGRFLTTFIALVPDEVFFKLKDTQKVYCEKSEGGVMVRRKALFYVVELHQMTLKTAVSKLAVSVYLST